MLQPTSLLRVAGRISAIAQVVVVLSVMWDAWNCTGTALCLIVVIHQAEIPAAKLRGEGLCSQYPEVVWFCNVAVLF